MLDELTGFFAFSSEVGELREINDFNLHALEGSKTGVDTCEILL